MSFFALRNGPGSGKPHYGKQRASGYQVSAEMLLARYVRLFRGTRFLELNCGAEFIDCILFDDSFVLTGKIKDSSKVKKSRSKVI